MKTKHVAIVIRDITGRSGGAERVYCELANILVDSGYRVTCLFFDAKGGEAFYPLDHRIERINLYGKARCWMRRRARWSSFFSRSTREKAEWDIKNGFFIQQLKDYFSLVAPDVAISILPPANTPVLLAAWGTSVKVIACNHNVPEQDYNNPNRWSPNEIDRHLRLRALDKASAIHVLFPDFAKWFPSHLQSKIVAIPNHISPHIRWPNPRPQRQKTVLAVGRLIQVKNYMQLIRSWASLAHEFPDWKVKIFGVGPQLKALEEEIVRFDLTSKVELRGHVSDLSEEYARASIFCHPAYYEGFGLSAAEALYLETPVVFYADCSGVNEFVIDGYNGLAVDRHGEQDNLAATLRRLITDEEFRLTLGANGPPSVSRFSLDEYRTSWIDLIEKTGSAD